MRGCYTKHVNRDPHVHEDLKEFEEGIEWLSEMKDSSSDAYYVGALPLGS